MRATIVVAALVTFGSTAHGESLVEPQVVREASPAAKPIKPTKPEVSPRVSIGQPGQRAKIERVWVRIAHDDNRAVATITLELVGPDATNRDVTVPITIPPGAKATGLALVGFAGSHLITRERADEVYRHTVEKIKEDPALLEWQGRARAGDLLRLRAYPVAAGNPMRVEFTVELPHARFAQVDLGAQTVGELAITTNDDHKEWRRASGKRVVELFPLPAPPAASPAIHAPLKIAPRKPLPELPADAPGIDAQLSLIAGGEGLELVAAPPVPRMPNVRAAPFVRVTEPATTAICNLGGDRRNIRRYVRRQQARLRHCYMAVAQRDPTIAGTLDLQFLIQPSGKVKVAGVAGPLPEAVTSCVRREVESWQFGPADGAAVQVNYPLTFQLANPPPRE